VVGRVAFRLRSIYGGKASHARPRSAPPEGHAALSAIFGGDKRVLQRLPRLYWRMPIGSNSLNTIDQLSYQAVSFSS
jgi:hypothetical protein